MFRERAGRNPALSHWACITSKSKASRCSSRGRGESDFDHRFDTSSRTYDRSANWVVPCLFTPLGFVLRCVVLPTVVRPVA